MDQILHITSSRDWQQALAAGAYRADTLDTEGFIHCSSPTQVVEVANRLFAGRSDLLLLHIDPAKLQSDLRYEPAENGQTYPHVYGPIDLEAVARVMPLRPDPQGRFEL